MEYKETGTQTEWAGLTKADLVRPDILLSPPPNTTTPPDDMLTEKAQYLHNVPSIRLPHDRPPHTASLLERRQNRVGLDPHIALPEASRDLEELNDEVPLSPPPTHALLSPLPEANKRHAGHTPLVPRALSPAVEADAQLAPEQAPEQPAEDRIATPDLDEALTGALTLPSNPVDGADDHIELSALDRVLGKIAKQQAILRGEFDDDEPQAKSESKAKALSPNDDGLSLSRKASADSHRSGATEEVDGVILKSPRSNFGAPLGSLYNDRT